MEEGVTKEDLRQLGLLILDRIGKIIQSNNENDNNAVQPEWLKSHVVRKLLDISPGSLQNLRITGKIRFKKVLGSYYYNRTDLMQLFNDNKSSNAAR